MKKNLEIKSATGKIELAGGDAAVHRVGDPVGMLIAQTSEDFKFIAPDGSTWVFTTRQS